jgi:acyl carrier protein
MNEQEILARFAQTVEEFTDVPAAEVTPESDLTDDLAIDSLSMVEIIGAVQDRFGVDVSDEDMKDLKTVQDVVSYVQRAPRSDVSA